MLDFERRDSDLTGSSSVRCSRLEGRRDKRKERLNTELLKAVRDGDEDKVTRLLYEGAAVDSRCRLSLTTACHLAASSGNDSILDILLDAKASITQARDRSGRQPHHLAAASGHLSSLLLILHRDPDLVNSPILPLNDVAIPNDTLDSWNHNHEEFQNLVPDSQNIGRTALHLAAERCNWQIVELLLTLGADPNSPDMNGLSALDVTGQHPYHTGERVKTFSVMRGFVPVSMKDGVEDDTTQTNPSEKVCSLLIDNGAVLPKAQVIIKDGVVINQRRMNVTALHTAVMQEDTGWISYLLEMGACPLTWNGEGQTACHLAVKRKSEAILRLLLSTDKQAVTEARDVQGRTPLLQAVEEGWADGVAMLLEAGADVTVTSNSNQTVLHFAAQHGHAPILEELLSIQEISKVLDRTNTSYETPLCLAVKMNHLNCVKLLCRHNADCRFLLLPGDQSLLHVAVMNDSVDILHCLLEGSGKARIDLKTKEEKGGLTPLHIAAKEGYADCADELVSMGADTRMRNKHGDTALHLACKEGHLQVVRLLIKQDPELMEMRNGDGWAPLHVAAAESNADCVRQLVLHGADLSAEIKYEVTEKTAIDLICSSIPKSPEFLEDILNHYVEVLRGPVNDPECEILLNYDVLMPCGESEKQLKVIGAIMNSGRQTVQDRLMPHPLIESFLYLKWRKFNCLFIFVMVLYFILTLSITTLAHITFVENTKTRLMSIFAMTSRIILFVVLVPIISVEIVNLSQLQRYYFMDYESWVKWTVIIFTCVVESLSPSIFWIRYMASVAVLLSWVELLFLLSRCPTWGFYVLMFSKVAIKTLKVLATFSLLIIGFAFSFLILFQAHVPFRNMLEAVVKVIVMMVEFDYEDMFNGVNKLTTFSVVGRLMFVVFVLIVALVMMNLIVGVAVSDISRLEAQGRTEQLVKQASFLSFLEMFLYSGRFKGLPKSWKKALEDRRSVQRTIAVKPGRPSSSQVYLPRTIVDNLIFNIKTRNIRHDNISASLQNISDGIDNIALALREFYTNHQKAHIMKNDKQFEHILSLILEEQRQLREQLQQQKASVMKADQWFHSTQQRT